MSRVTRKTSGRLAPLAWLPLALLLLALPVGPTLAEEQATQADASGAAVSGSLAVGAHYDGTTGSPNKAAEYAEGDDDTEPQVSGDLEAHQDGRLLTIQALYYDEETQRARMRASVGQLFKNVFQYRSFYHWLDHDILYDTNVLELQNPQTGEPGLKMITSEDTAPRSEYALEYNDLENITELNLPLKFPVSVRLDYRHQDREGHKQTRSLNHCATCHIVGRRSPVDERTDYIGASVGVDFGRAGLLYAFQASDFDNNAQTPKNLYEYAGTSRMTYGGEELEYGKVPDNKVYAHSLTGYLQLTDKSDLLGSMAYMKTRNEDYNLALKQRSGAARWEYMPEKHLTLGASASYRRLENDDVDIDLPPWQAGQRGGGQSFDWTRESVYDRREVVGQAYGTWHVLPRQHVRFEYRYREVARDHLYLDYENTEKESDEHRAQLSWYGTLAKKLYGRLSYEYLHVSWPFANHIAMNEPPAQHYAPLPDNSSLYYFQRIRDGESTNQPDESHILRANLTYQCCARASTNLIGQVSLQENDVLNTYEWQRQAWLGGLNVFTTLGSRVALTTGYCYTNTLSTALFSLPVMDGFGGAVFTLPGGAGFEHFGSIDDPVDYEAQAHTLFIHADVKPAPRLALYLRTALTAAEASFDAVDFGHPKYGLAKGDYDFSAINHYSKVDQNEIEVSAGGSFQVNSAVGLFAGGSYIDFDDDQHYRFADRSGKAYTISGGVQVYF